MNPQYERLDERLEQVLRSPVSGTWSNLPIPDQNQGDEAEVEELFNLARHLQAAPHLRVDAEFAETLERRVREHAFLLRPRTVRGRPQTSIWTRPHVWAAIIGIGVLVMLLGIGSLVLGKQTIAPSPARPPLAVGKSTPLGEKTPTVSPAAQAATDLQIARADLQRLPGLVGPTQTNAYLQALILFDTQLTSTAHAVSALPTGAAKTSLTDQLGGLKTQARQELRSFLPALSSSASAATTSELGSLGEPIPQVRSASIVLPAHPPGTATLTLIGNGIQPGASLLVDGKRISVTGTLQAGQIVFVLLWKGKQHPHSLGILNPDGTVAQTEDVTVTTAATSGNGNGNGNGKGQ